MTVTRTRTKALADPGTDPVRQTLAVIGARGDVDGRLLQALVVDALVGCDDELERLAALVALADDLLFAAGADPNEAMRTLAAAKGSLSREVAA